MVHTLNLRQAADIFCKQNGPRSLGLIWIQTVWCSDGIPERFIWKGWFLKKSVDNKKHEKIPREHGVKRSNLGYKHYLDFQTSILPRACFCRKMLSLYNSAYTCRSSDLNIKEIIFTFIPPLFISLEYVVCLIFRSAAHIQLHFRLDFFMEANTMNTVTDHPGLTLKAPIMTATDDKLCCIFPNLWKK